MVSLGTRFVARSQTSTAKVVSKRNGKRTITWLDVPGKAVEITEALYDWSGISPKKYTSPVSQVAGYIINGRGRGRTGA